MVPWSPVEAELIRGIAHLVLFYQGDMIAMHHIPICSVAVILSTTWRYRLWVWLHMVLHGTAGGHWVCIRLRWRVGHCGCAYITSSLCSVLWALCGCGCGGVGMWWVGTCMHVRRSYVFDSSCHHELKDVSQSLGHCHIHVQARLANYSMSSSELHEQLLPVTLSKEVSSDFFKPAAPSGGTW